MGQKCSHVVKHNQPTTFLVGHAHGPIDSHLTLKIINLQVSVTEGLRPVEESKEPMMV